jgi:gamma-glutamyl-gamma-aminobutyraldehyde dehydrogenase
MEKSANFWYEMAQDLKTDARCVIGGQRIDSDSGERFLAINPATKTSICDIPAGSGVDVDRAVRSARTCHEDGRWRLRHPSERKAVLLRIASLMERDGDELALLDSLEMGKPISESRVQVSIAASFFRYYAEAIDKIYSEVAPSDRGTLAFTLFEPRGVIGAIVPWNFPIINAAWKVAPALAAGNAIVLKPSEKATLSTLRLADLAAEAGLPDGALNAVPGLGPITGKAVAAHKAIDLLTFTGSTTVGRQIMATAGLSNGKPVHLELGGKSPQILCADMGRLLTDIAPVMCREAFWNCGQWCVARSRLIVHRSLHDAALAGCGKKRRDARNFPATA